MKETVQMTIRLPAETHKELRHISIDTGEPVNSMLNRFALLALEEYRSLSPKP